MAKTFAGTFDTAALTILQRSFDLAWQTARGGRYLLPFSSEIDLRRELAARIMTLAATGETSIDRLTTHALKALPVKRFNWN